jgi:hypothetical protein
LSAVGVTSYDAAHGLKARFDNTLRPNRPRTINNCNASAWGHPNLFGIGLSSFMRS